MGSIVHKLRSQMRGIPEDAPLDYSQIADNLYIAAWPTRVHRQQIIDLGVRLVISTILEKPDRELGEPPLRLVRVRAADMGKRLFFPDGQIMKGVEAALPVLERGEDVMVFCRAGMHRSATLTACILAAQDYSPDAAIRLVLEKRSRAHFNESHRQKIKRFAEQWRQRHPSTPSGSSIL